LQVKALEPVGQVEEVDPPLQDFTSADTGIRRRRSWDCRSSCRS